MCPLYIYIYIRIYGIKLFAFGQGCLHYHKFEVDNSCYIPTGMKCLIPHLVHIIIAIICDRLWENQTIGAEFSIELQLNLCLQYKISNKILLVYKYLQSFYYISVKSDALNPTLSIETLRPNFHYYLIFPN